MRDSPHESVAHLRKAGIGAEDWKWDDKKTKKSMQMGVAV